MNRVFDISVMGRNCPGRLVELSLPATTYELMDMLEQLGDEDIDALDYWIEDTKVVFLPHAENDEITVKQLNHIALKVSQMDELQRIALGGLIKMECRKRQTDHLAFPKLLHLIESADFCHVIREAKDDKHLGRFYAENGFIEGVDALPDWLFKILDFEKIGREMRVAEGGFFAYDGYVVRHQELPEPSDLPNLNLVKPDYTILLEIRENGDPNAPYLDIELPLLEDKIEELQEKYPRREYEYSFVDCAIPFFREYIGGVGTELWEINQFAKQMDHAIQHGPLPKYKAVLQATGCRDVEIAAELGSSQTLAEYQLSAPQRDMDAPTAYAVKWVQEHFGRGSEMEFLRDIRDMKRSLMAHDNIGKTDYGLIQRIDGEPIQQLDQTPSSGLQMGGIGGM